MKIEGVNHIALRVREAARSAEFYQHYCGMEIVQQRAEGDMNNIWVRLPNQKDGFMLVLFETLGESSAATGTMDHIGIYVESRKDVDDIAERARSAGALMDGIFLCRTYRGLLLHGRRSGWQSRRIFLRTNACVSFLRRER